MLISERNMFEQEYWIVKSNGGIVLIYDYTTLVRDENGAITHFYGWESLLNSLFFYTV
jgi:hypothetical protein